MGNEDVYGARLVERLAEDHGGKGWLIIDQSTWDAAKAAMKESRNFIWFQIINAYVNLYWNHQKASTITELAAKCNISPGVLEDTIARYNAHAAKGEDLDFRKS